MNSSINPLIQVLEKKANAFDVIKNTAKRMPHDADLGAWVREYVQSQKIEEDQRSNNKTLLFD
jgi:hypothetical protein